MLQLLEITKVASPIEAGAFASHGLPALACRHHAEFENFDSARLTKRAEKTRGMPRAVMHVDWVADGRAPSVSGRDSSPPSCSRSPPVRCCVRLCCVPSPLVRPCASRLRASPPFRPLQSACTVQDRCLRTTSPPAFLTCSRASTRPPRTRCAVFYTRSLRCSSDFCRLPRVLPSPSLALTAWTASRL